MAKDFKDGQRVRTTVDAPAAPGFPKETGVPAGSRGTVKGRPGPFGGYGVVLDVDPHKLPAHYDADELEAI